MESYSYYLLLNHIHFCSLLCLFILFYSSVLMNTVMFYLNNKYFCILNSLHSKCFFFFFFLTGLPRSSPPEQRRVCGCGVGGLPSMRLGSVAEPQRRGTSQPLSGARRAVLCAPACLEAQLFPSKCF